MKAFIQSIRRIIARSLGEEEAAAKQYWEIDLLLTLILGSILFGLGSLYLVA